jgi:hypothetical protein
MDIGIADLTGNDVAQATEAIQLALGWWKKQPGRRTKYGKEQQRRMTTLLSKLDFMLDQAYPHSLSDFDFTSGDESIYRPNFVSIRRMNAKRRKTKALVVKPAGRRGRA